MKNNFIKAFTVIEILFVIAILGLLIVIILPSLNDMRSRQILNSTISDIVSTVNKASSNSLASLDSSAYGVRFDSNKVTLFKGIVYDVNDVNNEIINIVSPANINSISLTGGATSLYFNRLTNKPNVTGTVTVTVSNLSKVITIDATGKISVN